MRYPVTFKQDVNDLLTAKIRDYLQCGNYCDKEIWVYKSEDAKQTNIQFNKTFWFGMLIDTRIVIRECSQVFKAYTVSMQSQTRLGFKDYGYNYDISKIVYSFLY